MSYYQQQLAQQGIRANYERQLTEQSAYSPPQPTPAHPVYVTAASLEEVEMLLQHIKSRRRAGHCLWPPLPPMLCVDGQPSPMSLLAQQAWLASQVPIPQPAPPEPTDLTLFHKLPLELLHTLCTFLPTADLMSLQSISDGMAAATHMVGVKRDQHYTLDINGLLPSYDDAAIEWFADMCSYIRHCCSSLRLCWFRNNTNNDEDLQLEPTNHAVRRMFALLFETIEQSELLTELELCNNMEQHMPHPLPKRLLVKIRSLTLDSINHSNFETPNFCDEYVAELLRTCDSQVLRHLTVRDMRLSGGFLDSVTGQLESLSLLGIRGLESDQLNGYLQRFPVLRKFSVHEKQPVRKISVLNEKLALNLQHCTDLHVVAKKAYIPTVLPLTKMREVRRVHLDIDSNEEAFTNLTDWYVCTWPKVQELSVSLGRCNAQIARRFGAGLQRLMPELRRIELIVDAERMHDVSAIVHRLAYHESILDVRLGGVGLATYARMLHESGMRQRLTTLHVRCVPGEDLRLLADMPALRELRVAVCDEPGYLDVRRSRVLAFRWDAFEQQLHVNELLRSLALVNRVRVFQLQWPAASPVRLRQPEPGVVLAVEPATMRRLAGWTALRYCALMVRTEPAAVAEMWRALSGLEMFEAAKMHAWPDEMFAWQRQTGAGPAVVSDRQVMVRKRRSSEFEAAERAELFAWKFL